MRQLCMWILMASAAFCASARADVTGYFQITCLVDEGLGPCGTNAVTIGGRITSDALSYTSPNYSGAYDSYWGVHYETSIALSYDFKPDLLRAKVVSSTTLSNPISGAEIGHAVLSRGYIDTEFIDGLNFASSTLAAGTVVNFKVTAELHSVFSTNEDATCQPGQTPRGYAVLAVNGHTIGYHSTCGDGSETQQASFMAQSTVGGHAGLDTIFRLQGESGTQNPYGGTFYMTSDASHTATLRVDVLTSGVSFTSDSGALYQPLAVPEAPTVTLIVSGLCLLAAARGIRLRAAGPGRCRAARLPRRKRSPRALHAF